VFCQVLGVPQLLLHSLPPTDPLATALKSSKLSSGVYAWPTRPSGEASKDPRRRAAYLDQFRQGPVVEVFYTRQGAEPMSTTLIARGLLHFFAASLLAGVLLAVAGPRLKSYGSRVGFVVLLGLFATVMVNLSPPIWLHHPWGYHLAMVVVDGVNALLMGIVLGAIVKPGAGPYWSLDGK